MCMEAYFAGLLDADGCVTITRSKGRGTQLVVNFTMVDREPLDLLADTYGSRVRPGRVTLGGKQTYQWAPTGERAQAFLRDVQPWMVIKVSQVRLALQFRAKTYELTGDSLTDALEEREYLCTSIQALNQRRN